MPQEPSGVSLKKLAYAAAYGMGEVGIGRLCGQYPPPDFLGDYSRHVIHAIYGKRIIQ